MVLGQEIDLGDKPSLISHTQKHRCAHNSRALLLSLLRKDLDSKEKNGTSSSTQTLPNEQVTQAGGRLGGWGPGKGHPGESVLLDRMLPPCLAHNDGPMPLRGVWERKEAWPCVGTVCCLPPGRHRGTACQQVSSSAVGMPGLMRATVSQRLPSKGVTSVTTLGWQHLPGRVVQPWVIWGGSWPPCGTVPDVHVITKAGHVWSRGRQVSGDRMGSGSAGLVEAAQGGGATSHRSSLGRQARRKRTGQRAMRGGEGRKTPLKQAPVGWLGVLGCNTGDGCRAVWAEGLWGGQGSEPRCGPCAALRPPLLLHGDHVQVLTRLPGRVWGGVGSCLLEGTRALPRSLDTGNPALGG